MARNHPRLRAATLLLLAVTVGVAAALLVLKPGQGPVAASGGHALGDRAPGQPGDPFAYHEADRASFEQRAADGLAHVLYAKSPGGAIATAERVAALRPLVDRAAADGTVVDPDTLEAIVFLESAGRPDAQASSDLNGAAGLTQILAQTATGLLGLRVDLEASAKLTRGIARGTKVAQRRAARRRVDERFDPRKALAATVRYLRFARGKLDERLDLAVESYHMGVGNLQGVLAAYGDKGTPSYAQLYFGSTPLSHPEAQARLAGLGDDSATYLWRVLAVKAIMRDFRRDRAKLERTAALQTQKNSAENLLHPPQRTPAFADPFALGRARAAKDLVLLDPLDLAGHGIRIDSRMGELAGRLHQSPALYHALAPPALVTLRYIGDSVQAIAGRRAPLIVTSAARDQQYQRLLIGRNAEATRGFSLHTTGYAFDIARVYRTPTQAQAFQFVLDRLTALDVIAWVREPGAIHVTAGPRAALLAG